MWSVCVVTVVNSIERQCSTNERENGSTIEQEDSSTNEQKDSSTNEEAFVTVKETSRAQGAAFTIEGNPASNVEGQEKCKWWQKCN